MIQSPVSSFDATIQKTHLWLKELTDIGSFENEAQAYSAMRAVLHALRDRLTVEEAVHLAAELPMLIRGFYYEGWKPSLAPNRERSRTEFLQSVQESLRSNQNIGPERATRATFELLSRKISQGELQDVRRAMPEELQELWEGVTAG